MYILNNIQLIINKNMNDIKNDINKLAKKIANNYDTCYVRNYKEGYITASELVGLYIKSINSFNNENVKF